MMNRNKKFTDFLTDYTNIQMLQYRGSMKKYDRNFTINYSNSVTRPHNGNKNDDTHSDGILEFIEHTEDKKRAQSNWDRIK